MRDSQTRRVGGRGSGPTIGARIISAARVQVVVQQLAVVELAVNFLTW